MVEPTTLLAVTSVLVRAWRQVGKEGKLNVLPLFCPLSKFWSVLPLSKLWDRFAPLSKLFFPPCQNFFDISASRAQWAFLGEERLRGSFALVWSWSRRRTSLVRLCAQTKTAIVSRLKIVLNVFSRWNMNFFKIVRKYQYISNWSCFYKK